MIDKKTLDIPPLSPTCKGYRILFEKEAEPMQKFPVKDFEELYEKIQENPQMHLAALKQFYDLHPAPEVANLLAFAYLKVRKKKLAEALIEKTYLDYPDYLIARINYADQCLRLKKKEWIPKIFNGCFDLNALYPQRDSFHFAEFRGFMTVMGFYHVEIGEIEKGEEYCQLAFQVDPLHPSIPALERKIFKKKLTLKLINLVSLLKKH
jgi:hypothetical protein